jgi:hypothetical protein
MQTATVQLDKEWVGTVAQLVVAEREISGRCLPDEYVEYVRRPEFARQVAQIVSFLQKDERN